MVPSGQEKENIMSVASATAVPAGYELRFVDPASIHDNPNNVRARGRDREGLADSIKQLGILSPPLATEDSDGVLTLIAGERRIHSDIAAGLTEIPVYVRSDMTPVQQVAGMLVENRGRDDLTEVEEAVGIQKLAGMDVTQKEISALTGVPTRDVRKAIAVAKSEVAVGVAQQYDLSLDQALVLAEFDDDTEAVKELAVAAVKSPWQFDHIARRRRNEREEAKQRSALAAELAASEVPVVALVDGYALPEGAEWLDELPAPKGRKSFTEAAHRRCPGHAAAIRDRRFGSGVEIAYCCTDPVGNAHIAKARATANGQPKATGMSEEQKAERRKVIANNKAWPAATEVRRTFVRELVSRRSAPRSVLRYVAEVLAADPGLAKVTDEPVALLLGTEVSEHPWERTTSTGLVDGASDPRLPLALLALVGAGVENRHSGNDAWRSGDVELARWLRFLASVGYGLAEVEQEVVDRATAQDHA
jgi:ParB family chromosome partitioning protein